MRLITRFVMAALACATVPAAMAGDFDGSKLLICAPVEAMDCTSGEECALGRPDDIGAPAFMRIDFAKKSITGPKRSTEILFMEKSEDQLLLQGTELGHAWTLALDQMNGKMAVTLVDREGVFVLFGSCTPL
jgi:hypothetical protein